MGTRRQSAKEYGEGAKPSKQPSERFHHRSCTARITEEKDKADRERAQRGRAFGGRVEGAVGSWQPEVEVFLPASSDEWMEPIVVEDANIDGGPRSR